MITLIIAGEVIFFLPFVLPRIFRPTILSVFEIDTLQLGLYMSLYGFVAIGAYFFGGPLADKFSPHKLMAAALLTTGLGGLYLYTLPPNNHLYFIYGFWGLTTILLFWAALMRTTRLVGGEKSLGISFGLLDGGRGLVAALVSVVGVSVLSSFLPENADLATKTDKAEALKMVILLLTGFVFLTSVLVFWVLSKVKGEEVERQKFNWSEVVLVLKNKSVWLQATIILCAYSGYRVSDNFSLLVSDVLNYNDVEAAFVGTLALWLRPISAISAGYFADRSSPSKVIMACFVLMTCGGLLFAFSPENWYSVSLIVMVICSTCIGVYAMRGLYFSIMGEAKIPLAVTGTAVGLASVIGYLPDIYMTPLMGVLLNNYPGIDGHKGIFMLLVGFSIVGLLATILFRKLHK